MNVVNMPKLKKTVLEGSKMAMRVPSAQMADPLLLHPNLGRAALSIV